MSLNVAVIGAGVQGRSFAAACALVGFAVVLEDVMPARLRDAGKVFAELGQSVALVTTVEDAVRDADVVVDFVPDELESKLEIWSLIDRMAPPRTVMCTPSGELSLTDLASCTYRADRCAMVRGDLAGAGELLLISARGTSEATRACCETLFCGLGRAVKRSDDPDLPMLLKNMNAQHLV